MEKLYANIGEKIEKLAFVSFIVEAIASIIGGIAICADGYLEGLGVLLIFLGPVVAFVGSWQLYGFGQLIENSDLVISNEKKQQNNGEEILNSFNALTPSMNANSIQSVENCCECCHKPSDTLYYATLPNGSNGKVCSKCFDAVSH